MQLDTFRGDYEELAGLIQREWDGYFGERTHFRYDPRWLADFFGAGGGHELLLEYRNGEGALAAFIGAVPRHYVLAGREVRLGLVTLLTSARANTTGSVGLEIERELFRRARSAGLFGTYHFCLDAHHTPNLLRLAAGVLKTRPIEVAPVTSLLRMARPEAAAADTTTLRPVVASDAPQLAELFTKATRGLPLARVVTADDVRASLDSAPARRSLVFLRDGAPIGACTYARRKLVGKETTEVANVDLLFAPDATPAEAARFGRALASDAAASGASFVIAPQREPYLFPHLREAGLRLSQRTLRVFIVPSEPGASLEPGSAHVLEVE
jgi:hypothetical protein